LISARTRSTSTVAKMCRSPSKDSTGHRKPLDSAGLNHPSPRRRWPVPVDSTRISEPMSLRAFRPVHGPTPLLRADSSLEAQPRSALIDRPKSALIARGAAKIGPNRSQDRPKAWAPWPSSEPCGHAPNRPRWSPFVGLCACYAAHDCGSMCEPVATDPRGTLSTRVPLESLRGTIRRT
jgi:hypothetical protein